MNAPDASAATALPHSDAGLAHRDSALPEAVAAVQAARRVAVNVESVVNFPPVLLDATLLGRVRAAAAGQGYRYRDIVSDAGHDAVSVARTAPAAMIFVPCSVGISLNEIEDARPEHLAAGCPVLLAAMLHTAGRAA